MKSLILAGGCFWCTEAIFKHVSGVEYVTPGYIGGKTVNPSYEEVCSETTGHAEAVKIIFLYAKLHFLNNAFFEPHDSSEYENLQTLLIVIDVHYFCMTRLRQSCTVKWRMD